MIKDTTQYIELGLAKERYAIPIGEIQEIIRMQPLTPVPNTHREVQGVINLRGKVVPVVSLRRLFSLPNAQREHSNRIIIVNNSGEAVGLIVDRVYRVASYTYMQPSQDNNKEYISSIGQSGQSDSKDEPVAIIAVEALLRIEQP